MALQKNNSSSWTQNYYNNLRNGETQCKLCSYITQNTSILKKVHLFRSHKIFHDEDIDDRYGPIWRYFTEEERYTLKCKICDIYLSSGYLISVLKNHIKFKHPQIIKEIQKEFEHSWISAHFILNTSNDKVNCKICYDKFDLLKNKVDDLTNHLSKHGINKKTREDTGGSDMNINHQSKENNE